MKIVDTNILLYLANSDAPQHAKVIAWWEAAMNRDEPLGLTWVGLVSFIRVSTKLNIFRKPLSVEDALERVNTWLDCPNIRLIGETSRQWIIFRGLIRQIGAGGNLTNDALLASLAITHNATLVSCDVDFGRFARLDCENPMMVH